MLTRRGGPRPRTESRSLVRCTLRGARFLVPPERVVEVVRLTTHTPLPCEDPANLGVVLHRDRVIPLVDLGPRLGVVGGPLTLPALCVIVVTDLGEVAAPVDQVLGFVPIGPDTILEDPVLPLDRFGERHAQSAAG